MKINPKIVFAISVLIALIVSAAIFLVSTQSKIEPTEGKGNGRPTELLRPLVPDVPLTDPMYAEPEIGTGVQGPEDDSKKGDPDYFQDLFLPFIDEPNMPAGSGFNVKAEGLSIGSEFTAVAYPRGSNASNPVTVQVGKGTVDAEGKLEFIVSMPTNLSLGSYTLEVKGSEKTFTTPFVIRPSQG